ncbi:MAG: hypothetical protein U0414_01325 [Polyangiaceae bacterium]
MEPIIDLAPGAEESPLARLIVERIRDSIDIEPGRKRSFLALKSTVMVVPFDTGNALTLRFDLGRLAVHDGNIGVPSVTLGLPTADLAAIDALHTPGLKDLVSRGASSRALAHALRLLAIGEVKIYGLWAHPRTIVRLFRLLSPPSDTARARVEGRAVAT